MRRRENERAATVSFHRKEASRAKFIFQFIANLQGALGKVSGRSYKAAPRQMLQVDNPNGEDDSRDAANEVAKQGREALAHATMVSFIPLSLPSCSRYNVTGATRRQSTSIQPRGIAFD